jgi:hypothetical protein
MVAKIGHGTSLFGAISYNKLKVDDENGRVLFARHIIEQANGTYQIPDILHSFEPYLSANKRTEKPVIHISLNPNPKDKVTDENFIEMAQKYMDELGFGEQPYIVFKHTDIEREHIHIVSVRVKADGSCISDAYEKRRSMEICRKLEQEFNLTPADKQERQNVLPLQKVYYSRGNVKRQVANAVHELAKSYHFQSFGEYRALLSLFNLTAEEVKGEHKGKPYNGLVYSVLNEKGEKVGNPFKSSLFGKSVGYDALQKRMEKEKQTWKTDKPTKNRLRADILITITESKKRKNFEKNLLKKGISVVFRENEQGRIYGVTFIDHQSMTVLNGSRLGKEFSANMFHEWFANGIKPEVSSKSNTQIQSKENEYSSFADLEKAPETNDVFPGVSLLEMHGDDYEDELFKRKMRKKRRTIKKPKL